ncbi:tyrosine-type recombinase/integrase [Porphyromonas gulae]|uniref:tyrosine-type recombinase/integrase n=1 Tax=Porphyromonas gulae TaxID=111105 RepID=UPI00068C0456|nr:tyrosine-type recombinase/integrase [Porphyromonas gulae]
MSTTRITTYLRAYSARRRCSANHKGNMRNAARYLERYEEYIGHHIEGKDFDYLCVESFFAYMRQYELRHNTIVKIAQTIVACVNHMRREGIQVGRDYEDFPLKEEEVTTVALSDEEIERVYNLKLSKKSAIIRDLFVFACETGLRYSDLVALQDDNIQGNILTVRTSKTGALVCIPLRRRAREIIARHDGAIRYTDSQTNYNKCVKTLCRRAGITEKVLCEYTVGTRFVRRSVPKYKLVSSHTGRRSFATNAYFAGIPVIRIMLITGHKTEQAFFRYIRVGKKENAKALSGHQFFK